MSSDVRVGAGRGKVIAKSTGKTKINSRKPAALAKHKLRFHRKKPSKKEFVVDRSAGLVFSSEQEVVDFFTPQLDFFSDELQKLSPVGEEVLPKDLDLDAILDETLDHPDEIWMDEQVVKDFPVFYFLRSLPALSIVHVAVVYVSSDDEPRFVFLHFVTGKPDLVEHYRREDLVYDKSFDELGFAMIEGDSLSEGDPLATGQFLSMLKIRSETDVPQEKFQDLGKLFRDSTIEGADEMWRYQDSHGHWLVIFIKEIHDQGFSNLHYVVVTLEDPNSQVHSLLFSFPTDDPSLVDRYRRGENLQTEEVAQESSH